MIIIVEITKVTVPWGRKRCIQINLGGVLHLAYNNIQKVCQLFLSKTIILQNMIRIVNNMFSIVIYLNIYLNNSFLWSQSWIFSSHYSSLQGHMILPKSFKYADLVLNKYLFWLLILKTVIFVCSYLCVICLTNNRFAITMRWIISWE